MTVLPFLNMYEDTRGKESNQGQGSIVAQGSLGYLVPGVLRACDKYPSTSDKDLVRLTQNWSPLAPVFLKHWVSDTLGS